MPEVAATIDSANEVSHLVQSLFGKKIPTSDQNGPTWRLSLAEQEQEALIDIYDILRETGV